MNAHGLNWLASFPKSGNTWTRMFLAAFLSDSDHQLELRQANRFSCSESRLDEFALLARKPVEQLSTEEIDLWRGPVQHRLAKVIKKRRVIKTHNARFTPSGDPLVWPQATRACVYVVRNPLDVVDSLSDHANLTYDQTIQLLNSEQHRLGRTKVHAIQHLGSWSHHVKSWTGHDEFPVFVLRYEDLIDDAPLWFGRMIDFLGWNSSEEKVQQAVDRCSFAKLSAAEAQYGFEERTAVARSGRFFRRGRSGCWPELLSPQQAQTVIDHHGETMAALGYSTDTGSSTTRAHAVDSSESRFVSPQEWDGHVM